MRRHATNWARCARQAVEAAREQVAAAVGVQPVQVVFTSGGTEANNLLVKGAALRRKPAQIAVSAIEHPCVARAGEATGATRLERRGARRRFAMASSGGRDLDAGARYADRHRVGDAREQRDRRDPAGRAARRTGARGKGGDAYRCGPGVRQDPGALRRPECRCDDAVLAQDLRTERRRRADRRQAAGSAAAACRRRARARNALRHRECRGDRRFRRRGGTRHGVAAELSRSRRAAACAARGGIARARRADFRRRGRPRLPIPATSPFPTWKGRRW